MARLVPASRPSTAGTAATRPSSSQSTATNFSRPLSTGPRRQSNGSLAAPSTRPTSTASSMNVIKERDSATPKGKAAGVWGGRWEYVLAKPKALYDTDSEQEEDTEDATVISGEPLQSVRGRRSKRLSAVQKIEEAATSRNVSGETLVPPPTNSTRPVSQLLDTALDMEWEVEKLPAQADTESGGLGDHKLKKKPSRLSTLGHAIASTVSVLGQRGRQAIESGKEKLHMLKDDKRGGKRARMDAVDEEDDDDEECENRPQKRAKIEVAAPKMVQVGKAVAAETHLHGWRRKRWLGKGLYIGQERDFDARLNEARNRKKRASKGGLQEVTTDNKVLPLPMFRGEQLLSTGERDFRLPFDVFCPLPPGQPKPDAWGKFQTNRFVGDAATEWKHHKQLPSSRCLCTPDTGCDEDCQNCYMLYECDESNCNVGSANCGNRPFADLKERCKSGRKYDIGVEVLKTEAKGYGVRACRTFEPGQIIMEYAGEIITQEECERRVATEYKDNACYYLMTFDQKMIIDATRGSMARFINHSCEPNCHMVKWIVAGKPRMALFAGDDGVMTGEELTYDYNFDPFSQKNVQTCHCGAPTCRGFLGPKPTKTIRQSRSASADEEDEEQSTKTKGKAMLKSARRSVQNFFAPPEPSDSNTSRKRKSTGSASALLEVSKKRRRNTDTDALTSLGDVDSDEKRITSTSTGSSTLVEPTASSSKNFEPSEDAKAGKLPKRRNTVDALRGVAKTIKRNASTLRAHATLRGALEKETQAEKDEKRATVSSTRRAAARASMAPTLEKLVFDFEDHVEVEQPAKEADHDEEDDVMGQAMTYDEEEHEEEVEAERPATSASTSSMIVPGIVRSVKGSRRVAAAKRAGMRIGKKMEKSMRVVTDGGEQ